MQFTVKRGRGRKKERRRGEKRGRITKILGEGRERLEDLTRRK